MVTEDDILGDPPWPTVHTKRTRLSDQCLMCGRKFTSANYGAHGLCKKCYESNRKKQRRNDPNDSYAEDERKRAREYYHNVYQKKRSDWLAEYRTACLKCGEKRSWVLAWHHIDPSTKKYNIGNGIPRKDRQNDIIEETKKCVNLCENCHREFHYLYGYKMAHPKESLEEYLKIKL